MCEKYISEVYLAVAEITKTYNFRDNKESAVVHWHEVVQDLLSTMEEKGFIEKPVIFSNLRKARLENSRELVFKTKKN